GGKGARGSPARGRREARVRGRGRGRARAPRIHVTTGIFGGVFDPPHFVHVALAREATRLFGLDKLVVLVAASPEHKQVRTPVDDRLALARAAFPGDDVRI